MNLAQPLIEFGEERAPTAAPSADEARQRARLSTVPTARIVGIAEDAARRGNYQVEA